MDMAQAFVRRPGFATQVPPLCTANSFLPEPIPQPSILLIFAVCLPFLILWLFSFVIYFIILLSAILSWLFPHFYSGVPRRFYLLYLGYSSAGIFSGFPITCFGSNPY